MGKLATTGGRVTRDNEDQEASASSAASSGRAFVAAPIRGIAPRGAVPRIVEASLLEPDQGERVRECRSSIFAGARTGDRLDPPAAAGGSVANARFPGAAGDSAPGDRGLSSPKTGWNWTPKTGENWPPKTGWHSTLASSGNSSSKTGEDPTPATSENSIPNTGVPTTPKTRSLKSLRHLSPKSVKDCAPQTAGDTTPRSQSPRTGGHRTPSTQPPKTEAVTTPRTRSPRTGGDPTLETGEDSAARTRSRKTEGESSPRTRSPFETATGTSLPGFRAIGDAGRPILVDGSRAQVCKYSDGRAWPSVRRGPTTRSILLLAAITMAILAISAPAAAVPTPSADPTLPRTGLRQDLADSTGLEDVYEDAFEDVFREEDRRDPGTVLDESELEIIRRSIARGLGLKRIPDPAKANVSQAEYERAHREYLKKVHLSFDEEATKSRRSLHVFHAAAHPGNGSSRIDRGHRRHRLFFPVEIPEADGNASVDHATLRLLLHGDYNDRSELDVQLYLRTFGSREPIARKRVSARDSRWLELDSTAAVASWLEAGLENLGLELEFLRDEQPIRRSFSGPVLNVFTESSVSPSARSKRSTPEELMSLHRSRRTKCKGESKKCCRHELTVMFKDLKGFEFIVYPKTFDAGYCKGRCPPRYNPAHHHALLQSLLWKEDRKKVPKPCCAPSKLDQLMIVYFDENDSTQLKVSYWKNIQVLECACS
nr:inhibin beta B chain [Megalopta genalis]XP_033334178.1 inhibin beta B chain [Megalopta genalis]XP_033334179.1 inhibin beta B chain [Megalopta genalis]